MLINPIVLDVLGVLSRSALLALTGYLQKRHLLTPEQSDKLVTLAVEHLLIWAPGALAVAWGLWKSYWGRKKLLVAQSAGYPISENEVKAIIKSGIVTPTVSTPKNTIPGVPA